MSNKKLTYEFPELNPKQKLIELVLYIANKCMDDPTYGKVKLAKILHFADFRSYQKYEKPITGARYIKLDQGPFPDGFNDLLVELEHEGVIRVKEQEAGLHLRKRVVALREPNLDIFTAKDISLIDTFIIEFWGKSAVEVSEQSHGLHWKMVEMLEPIAYEASLVVDEPLTQEDIEKIDKLAALYGF